MSDQLTTQIESAARLIVESTYVVAIIGSGLSAESGIPTFRGPGGLWTRFGEPKENGYDIFMRDPAAWWQEQLNQDDAPPRAEFRKAIEKAKPNPGHYALAELESIGILKNSITQNIDNLHYIAGSRAVTEIHGNRTKLRCIGCENRWPRDEFVIHEYPPRCPDCNNLVKGDTVMFGEPIPESIARACHMETGQADCMIAIGTSATVYPAANFPRLVMANGGILIEVNTHETPLSNAADVSLRGPSGEILPRIVERIKAMKAIAQ